MTTKALRITHVFPLLLVTLGGSTAGAEVVWTREDGGDLDVIRMSVTPAPEPTPAFRYRIMQRPIDLVAGNAAPYYYRAIMEMPRTWRSVRDRYGEAIDEWYVGEVPLSKLPLENVRDAARSVDRLVNNYLAEAVSRRDCDWQWNVEDMRGPEVISFLLEEVQQSRQFTRAMMISARLAVAEGRYDDALRYLQINYRLAQDIAEVPFLVCSLVGTALVSISHVATLDMIAAPDSPNLYWALTELPRPPIDYRSAMRFEFEIGLRIFPFLEDAETTERSSEEWARLWHQAWADLPKLMNGPVPNGAMVGTGAALVGYTHAKRRLIDDGMDAETVHAMPVGQVMAVYTARGYERITSEYEKKLLVPFWRVDDVDAERVLREARPLGGGQWQEFLPVATTLLPAVNAARSAEVRSQRDIDALRVIEALRMYAADRGQLPQRLEDIHQVPVPPNPATGQPFVYRLQDETAILELPASDGFPAGSRRFEITIQQPEW